MLLGAVNSVFEQKIKRFIAYSSINQIGFLVVGLLGPATTVAGAQAFIYFLVTYVLNMLVFFSILLCLLNFLGTVQASGRQIKIPLFFISDLRRFDFSNGVGNLVAVALVIVVFSLIGIPPLAGFFGKFYLLFYAFSIKSWTVLVLGIITSIISAYYYLRILRASFFEEKPQPSPQNDSQKFSAFIYFYWCALCVISLSFFYFDSNVANLCYENALSLYCLLW
jgi:NADH-quinone oxidoreductase subunit N